MIKNGKFGCYLSTIAAKMALLVEKEKLRSMMY
jgi:hypothetical protein